MEKFRAAILGALTKTTMQPILEDLENNPYLKQLDGRILELETISRGTLNPEVIVMIQSLKDIRDSSNYKKQLLRDLIELNWEREDAEQQFESMKRCFTELEEKDKESFVVLEQL